jgi:hypothetical protein
VSGPTVYPIPNIFHGVSLDVTPGTPTAMAATMGLAKPLEWNDKPTWLKDTSLRGVMTTGPFTVQQGVTLGELTFPESIAYPDIIGWVLANILGDLTVTGTGPFTTAFSLLNTAVGQPKTNTITEYYGPTTTSGARQFSGTAFSEVSIIWDVAKKYLSWSGKAASWLSNAAAAKPTDAQSTDKGIPGWQMLMGIGGPASGGTQVLECQSGKITIKRQVKPQYAGMNSPAPYVMMRGACTVAFSNLVFITKDESIYNHMINNDGPQLQFVWDNGLTGSNHRAIQIDTSSAAFEETKPDYGEDLLRWSTMGDFIATSTNAGASGGESPIKATLTNAIASGTYQ